MSVTVDDHGRFLATASADLQNAARKKFEPRQIDRHLIKFPNHIKPSIGSRGQALSEGMMMYTLDRIARRLEFAAHVRTEWMRQPSTSQAIGRLGSAIKTGKGFAVKKRAREGSTAAVESIPPSLDVLYKRPGFMLRRAHQIAVSLFMLHPDAGNITTTQYGVLVILRACEGLDQISLAKKVGLDRSTTGLVVKKLDKSGYLVRIADPKDLRRKVIVLTAKGERKLESLKGVAARAQELALSVFTPAEAKQFLALLTKFVNHFNETTRAPIITDT